MCLPRIGSWGLLNLVRFLGIGGQVHWHRKCSICAQTSGAYEIDGIAMIFWRFCRGQALPDFGETGLDIFVGMLDLE